MMDVLKQLDKLILQAKSFNRKNVLEAYYPNGKLYTEIPLTENVNEIAYDEGKAKLLYRTPLSYTLLYTTQKDKIVPEHFHKYKETIVVLSGKCEFRINEKNYILDKHDKLIIEPFIIHNFTPIEDVEALAIIEL